MRSPWFTIFLRVPMGTGVYGGDQEIWRDGEMSKTEALKLAERFFERLADAGGGAV